MTDAVVDMLNEVKQLREENRLLRAALEPTDANVNEIELRGWPDITEPQDWQIQQRNQERRRKIVRSLLSFINGRAGLEGG